MKTCQHNPLQPNTSLRIETHPFCGVRIACLVCSDYATVGRKSGKIRMVTLPVRPSAVAS